ncbi:MAG: hypothetical protein WAN43_06505 [Rhodomicrobium sp.]
MSAKLYELGGAGLDKFERRLGETVAVIVAGAKMNMVRREILYNSQLWSRITSATLLFIVFWMTAAAGFCGFIVKRGLGIEPGYTIDKMLDGTADRPFVYRRLVAALANAISSVLPDSTKEYLLVNLFPDYLHPTIPVFQDLDMNFRVFLVYNITFLFVIITLYLFRQVLLDAGHRNLCAVLASMSLVLAFPYIQTIGGFFYDWSELAFLSAAYLFAFRGSIVPLFILVIPATLNKETFLFFLPTMVPLLLNHFRLSRVVLITGSLIFISGVINILVKSYYAGSPGEVAVTHFIGNLYGYQRLGSYLIYEFTYGIVSPAGMSLVTLAIVSLLVARGWGGCNATVRRHILIAGVINVPLFFIFAETGELRNWSLMFIGFLHIIAGAIEYPNRVTWPREGSVASNVSEPEKECAGLTA